MVPEIARGTAPGLGKLVRIGVERGLRANPDGCVLAAQYVKEKDWPGLACLLGLEFTAAEHQTNQVHLGVFGEKDHAANITGTAPVRIDYRNAPTLLIGKFTFLILR